MIDWLCWLAETLECKPMKFLGGILLLQDLFGMHPGQPCCCMVVAFHVFANFVLAQGDVSKRKFIVVLKGILIPITVWYNKGL